MGGGSTRAAGEVAGVCRPLSGARRRSGWSDLVAHGGGCRWRRSEKKRRRRGVECTDLVVAVEMMMMVVVVWVVGGGRDSGVVTAGGTATAEGPGGDRGRGRWHRSGASGGTSQLWWCWRSEREGGWRGRSGLLCDSWDASGKTWGATPAEGQRGVCSTRVILIRTCPTCRTRKTHDVNVK